MAWRRIDKHLRFLCVAIAWLTTSSLGITFFRRAALIRLAKETNERPQKDLHTMAGAWRVKSSARVWPAVGTVLLVAALQVVAFRLSLLPAIAHR